MSLSASVVIPVRDGARWLEEVLAAVLAEEPGLEVLVIDSGSRDGSPEIARAAGVEVLEIDPAEFGHGRTRNLGAERTSGDLILFLTQDATPVPGWLAAHREAHALDPRVGAAYGPHLPRPGTSPMIARELTEFFAAMAPDGTPVLQDAEPFLSNVNASYRRACWEAVRFADLPYSEDQAFGRAMLAAGWRKAFHPGAAVLHAHDYGAVGFMRRYFDEYRGLRETSGHIEARPTLSTGREVALAVAADRRWMRERGIAAPQRVAWTARAALHHGGRKVFSALGSRAHRLPDRVQRAISLERRGDAPAGPRVPMHRPGNWRIGYQPILELEREGVAELLEPVPGQADKEHLHVAVVIPPFRRGSGGHSTIFNLLTRLEERGHTVTTWVHDTTGMAPEWPAVLAGDLREYFRPPRGPVFKGFDEWFGADVVLATGWDTVYPVLRLDHCRARAYLVQDHEPEFFATSAERIFAERTYSAGLYCIAASPWLADLLVDRYGAQASHFELGVDHEVYRPRPVERREDTVIFYARSSTPRRAVALGLLALQELRDRRQIRVVLFGDNKPSDPPFPHEDLGVATPEELAWAYSEATVGLSLSLTNYSLIPQEMLACGLPVVELGGGSVESVYGADGPIELAAADPIAIADALERLLEDEGLRERRAEQGRRFAAELTWERAANALEDGLREALRRPPPGPAASAGTAGLVPEASWHTLHRSVPVDQATTHEATERLYGRLTPEDVAAVHASLTEEQQQFWERSDEDERRRLTLVFGTANRIAGVLARTGLSPAVPPDEVHAMARGPLSAGGALYYADMLAEALRRVGGSVDDVRRGLDFGSSSGRVVRAMQAVWPDAEWHAVDPNEEAIAWAAEALPGIAFQVSPQDPPLPYADGTFDLVFAISIWSHYAEGAARRWLREMHRVVRPGGRLVITTHGPQSVNHYAGTGERSHQQLEHIRRALYTSGFWYAPEFGRQGDWGVSHPEWGTSFFTPEWLARAATPDWSIEDYAVGQNAGNQDVYTLRRR